MTAVVPARKSAFSLTRPFVRHWLSVCSYFLHKLGTQPAIPYNGLRGLEDSIYDKLCPSAAPCVSLGPLGLVCNALAGPEGGAAAHLCAGLPELEGLKCASWAHWRAA